MSVSDKRPPGRPALTEEQQEARRIRKNERNKNYYASKRERIQQRRAERYDPQEAQEKYQDNKEEILERQRKSYTKRKQQTKELLLEALQELGGVKDFTEFYENLKKNLLGVQMADLEALTRLVLLHAFTNQHPVEKSEQLVEIDPDTITFTD